jgi:hypothetical protein
VLSCDGTEAPTPWRVGVAGGAMRTEIGFDDVEADLAQSTITALLGWHPAARLGLDLGVGAVLGSTLEIAGADTDFDPGVLGTLTGSWLAVTEGEARPFVMLSLTASALTMTADGERLTALDLRAGVMLGKTFGERFTPYAVARAFGGPVSWTLAGEEVTGSDQHHYTVGAGASLRLPKRLDVFVEGSPLGERSLNLGVGIGI